MIKKNNNIFWIFILVISICGAIYGRYLKESKRIKLSESEIAFTCSNIKNKTIIAIKDKIFKDEYLRSMEDISIKTVNYPFIVLESNIKVYVLEKERNNLYKIAVKGKRTHIRSSYIECFIWGDFLEK